MKEALESYDLNHFKQTVLGLSKDEVIESAIPLCEEHGILVPIFLMNVGIAEKSSLILQASAAIWSFQFSYVEGAEKTSLFLFKRAHDIDPNNIGILEAMLDFSGPPEILLDKEESRFIARKILILDKTNKKAEQFLK
jgi:hypothetical protein